MRMGMRSPNRFIFPIDGQDVLRPAPCFVWHEPAFTGMMVYLLVIEVYKKPGRLTAYTVQADDKPSVMLKFCRNF